jgi:hypothetical protein
MLQSLRSLIELMQRMSAAIALATPFLLLTPLGMEQRRPILQMLDEAGIGIGRVFPILDYPRLSSILYSRSADDERLRVALAFEQLWRTVRPDLRAEYWEIPDQGDYLALLRRKETSREQMGIQRFRLNAPDLALRTPGQILRLQAFHVPDPSQWERESRLRRAGRGA